MTQPIRNIELIKIAANAIVIWLVVMDILPMTEVQQAATLSLAMALINAGGAYFQNVQTTALAEPKDEDGKPLVRADGGATRAQVRSMARPM